ncbi:MAG: DUF3822 family protein [Gelidibacter sp.]|nr:DUF3822 family protein [Gelidibacter sp.]
METGLKTFQKTNSLTQHNKKALSIQISLSGLSFCILNTTNHTIELLQHKDFTKKLTPFETLEQLKQFLDNNTVFSQSFDSVLAIFQNELSNLVPKSLYDETNAADYLKFNAKILKTDFVSHDEITINNSINVYVPLVNINNYLFDQFGAFEYKHASTILIDTILKTERTSTDSKIYLNISSTFFELIALKDGELVLYNSFEYSTKEDFVYYVLFALEQLGFNPETVITKLSGTIKKDDELYAMLYKYIRFVEFVTPNYSFKFDMNEKPTAKHNDFVILNSF